MGPKPKKSPSLENYPACDAVVAKIADELWGKTPGENIGNSLKVFYGKSPELVLSIIQTPFFPRILQR